MHNPEFTMVEWYRQALDFDELIEETLSSFISLFLPSLSSETLTYREGLQRFAGIDYLTATTKELIQCATDHSIDLPNGSAEWDKDTLLQFLVSFIVEPHLGKGKLTVLSHFPASQAALSKTFLSTEGEPLAYRFEVYYQGIELANGYDELTDAKEQKRRFEQANEERLRMGKDPLKIDEAFLLALHTLPSCRGVAVGFDRLTQLRQGKQQLKEILPLSWDEA